MDIFRSYRIEQNDEGYTLFLYINTNSTEFSEEFKGPNTFKEGKLHQTIEEFIEHNFEDVKITAVKIMIGSFVVASLLFGGVDVKAQPTSTQDVQTVTQGTYAVQPGDSLWIISNKTGVSIDTIKKLNNLASDTIYVGQVLKLSTITQPTTPTSGDFYTVQSGDSLWSISVKFGLSVSTLKSMNNLTSDIIHPGQQLRIKEAPKGISYTVKSGDTLWKLATTYNTTVNAIKSANNLTSDTLFIGQTLMIPTTGTPTEQKPTPVYTWPSVTYIVQPGDTVSTVAKKFGVTTDQILRYNYMDPNQWLDAGDKIAISGYAPRTYTVTPGEATAPARIGKIVDWVTEGQYIIKRGDTFVVVDVVTGKQFKAKMMGGYNHADIEPLTATDTQIMKSLYATWQWNPRAVVIFINGMNISSSLSGMPHSSETIVNNNVSGHFDLYLLNSSSHSGTTSSAYIQQHQDMVLKAGGK